MCGNARRRRGVICPIGIYVSTSLGGDRHLSDIEIACQIRLWHSHLATAEKLGPSAGPATGWGLGRVLDPRLDSAVPALGVQKSLGKPGLVTPCSCSSTATSRTGTENSCILYHAALRWMEIWRHRQWARASGLRCTSGCPPMVKPRQIKSGNYGKSRSATAGRWSTSTEIRPSAAGTGERSGPVWIGFYTL